MFRIIILLRSVLVYWMSGCFRGNRISIALGKHDHLLPTKEASFNGQSREDGSISTGFLLGYRCCLKCGYRASDSGFLLHI